jgi:hypothetical protein
LAGPCKHLTLRQWEVAVILSSLPAALQALLRPWLEAPTDRLQWPWPSTFQPHRLPFDEARELRGKMPDERYKLLRDELAAIRQTLDMPQEDCWGITRETLLVAHGRRLRQVAWWMGEPQVMQALARMLRPAGRA